MAAYQTIQASDADLTIGLVAGEASGDILGAGLMRALRKRLPRARFVGLGGPLMEAAGFHSLIPIERMSVMGLVEVLARLPEFFAIRRRLRTYFTQVVDPQVVVGIDSPDFTLGLEEQLRRRGLLTVHYVSPSVWAWRQRRVFKVARAVDLMLTLFPFEARFYEKYRVPVRFVGHPLADQIPLEVDQQAARAALSLGEGAVVALLPGSRGGEIRYLGETFVRTALWLFERRQDLQFVVPAVSRARLEQFREILERLAPDLPVRLISGRSREVMAAADVVLLASGTATLEAMLLKRPMVVAYRMAPTTFRLVSRLASIRNVALPNLLAREPLVPEFLQDAATPENLGAAVLERLENPREIALEQSEFLRIHRELKCHADEQAADAIVELLRDRGLLEKTATTLGGGSGR